MADFFDIDDYCDDIWECIFSSKVFNFIDILHLRYVCRRFSEICVSDKIWRLHRERRWKGTFIAKSFGPSSLHMFKKRYLFEESLKEFLTRIGREMYHSTGISKCYINQLNVKIKENNVNIAVMENTLKYFCLEMKEKLHLCYYAELLYSQVYCDRLTKEMVTIIDSPSENIHDLEIGTILMSKYFQPRKEISIKDIQSQLDDIANKVKEKLPDRVLVEPSLDADKTMTILRRTNEVLYNDMGFEGNADYYSIKNSFIEEVLKQRKGIPMTLAVIYISVTRRLGLKLEPINFPNHFLIRFQKMSNNKVTYFYIDTYNKGDILNEAQCGKFLNLYGDAQRFQKFFEVADRSKIFLRQVRNISNVFSRNSSMLDPEKLFRQYCFELMVALSPVGSKYTFQLMLAQDYIRCAVNLDEAVKIIAGSSTSHEFIEAVEKQKVEWELDLRPKHRYTDGNNVVRYRIGMVMHHRRFDYNCVIYGWDKICKMPESWKMQMGVHSLAKGDHQPFYNVLVDDGTFRYASQESLEPMSSPEEILHTEVGKYFGSFNGHWYVATEYFAERYPEDQPIPMVDGNVLLEF